MYQLVILRGLPGSGKSTYTNELRQLAEAGKLELVVCSADNYFTDKDSGEYKWDPKKLPLAHQACLDCAHDAMKCQVPIVVVDNTNIKRSHYQPYVDLAVAYGYETNVVTIGKFDEESCKLYAQRNKHNVPLATILRMAGGFEE